MELTKKQPIPKNEKARLRALKGYDILGTDSEEEFDRITELVSIICKTPISLVTLIDKDRLWFKSKVGLDINQTERAISFCQYTIVGDSIFEVENALIDSRFKNNPFVKGDPQIRFYAGAPLIDPDGHALGSLCVISDKPKKLTLIEKRALDILSKEIVLQVVARKERMELYKAKEKAEKASLLKTIFMGNLSHEVRTPLQGILGLTEILQSYDLDKIQRIEHLSHIKQRALDMQNIIDSLLDIASLESGQINATPSKIDLANFINEYYNKFIEENEGKYKLMTFKFHNMLVSKSEITIDIQHLIQVLNNLLYNALKFSKKGTITVKTECKQNQFLISVIDNGVGIPADKLDDIFVQFRQAHEGLSRTKGGIGLGLSICQKMVHLWGGTIMVKSKVDQGSTFTFSIPKK